ncbi:MAG: hypothetical protein H7A46_21300 [Verrucomicrobiales bacterium]|nr:hypothetical protein [Verrucomicrobiales bacterium]
MKQMFLQQQEHLDDFRRKYWKKLHEFGEQCDDPLPQPAKRCRRISQVELDRACKMLAESVGPDTPPRTWEELTAICALKDWSFLLETQTFDSFLCGFLELVWGCAGELHVDRHYRLRQAQTNGLATYQALLLLRLLLEQGIVPKHSTLEASAFGRRFSAARDGRPEGGREWAFARHWYSTFVDVLTAKIDGSYAWQPGSADLEIAPLPCSLQHYLQTEDKRRATLGVSCWGEWHFTVLRGTENEALAIEFLNNLMSSQKITERALRCAALPTVNAFYEIYKDSACLSLPERADLSLPRMTYGELRQRIFRRARSRADLFDYRHCMRELHGLLERLLNTPDTPASGVGQELIATLGRIKQFEDRELLLH